MYRPFWTRFLTRLREIASFGALAAAFGALAWLAMRLDTLPALQLTPWATADATAPLIVVDAGHGGHDGGAVANGVVEKHLALALAHRLRHHLESQGLRVKMTRLTDDFLSLEDRSRLANQLGATAFVSLHLNTSVTAPEVTGLETYYSRRKSLSLRQDLLDDEGPRLARCIQRHACRLGRAEDRGIREKPYAVVSNTECPAVLVECGFLTNAAEAARLSRAEDQDCLTAGIAFGVAEFIKIRGAKPPAPRQVASASSPLPAAEDPSP
ncbi:MAG TPA: N-acetylmuramoyl-L-alanine amidase [Prosthecobacter sp.]|nr:N-acetylmuramoyl-L-alanine amidase [Prosthecobacter sp.]